MVELSLVQRIEEFLTARRRPCTYRQLFHCIGVDFNNRGTVYEALRAMDRRRHAEGKPILSVLVRRSDGTIPPGQRDFLIELGVMRADENASYVVARLTEKIWGKQAADADCVSLDEWRSSAEGNEK